MTTFNDNAGARAIALVWDGREAPTVVAKGDDELGAEIIALAKQFDVPLYEDAQLVKLLSAIELDQQIPPPLYLAVAKVIAFAYFVSGRTSVLAEKEV
jgi:flagellar biosynthesis protein